MRNFNGSHLRSQNAPKMRPETSSTNPKKQSQSDPWARRKPPSAFPKADPEKSRPVQAVGRRGQASLGARPLLGYIYIYIYILKWSCQGAWAQIPINLPSVSARTPPKSDDFSKEILTFSGLINLSVTPPYPNQHFFFKCQTSLLKSKITTDAD